MATESLRRKLAAVLPAGHTFTFNHVQTPPTKSAALYAAPAGQKPDKTHCASHFLSASTAATSAKGKKGNVLVFAIEVLIYTTASLTTIFVAKADSTGYLSLAQLPRGTPSPLKGIATTFLEHLVEQNQRPGISTVVTLFARAQNQYLFPGSVHNKGKHVLDDRGLVRWWCRVFNPLTKSPDGAPSRSAYLIVPGLDKSETRLLLPAGSPVWQSCAHPLEQITRYPHATPRTLIPHFPDDPKSRFLDELDAEVARTMASPRKRGRTETTHLSHWKAVRSLDQFWDMMAFRQECSSGRLTGFIWVLIPPADGERPKNELLRAEAEQAIRAKTQERQNLRDRLTTPPPSTVLENQETKGGPAPADSSQELQVTPKKPTHKKKKKLRGPIPLKEPRLLHEEDLDPARGSGLQDSLKINDKDYEKAHDLLLRLDFEDLELALNSSARWTSEVAAFLRVRRPADCAWDVAGEMPLPESTAGTTATTGGVTMLVGRKRKGPGAEGGPNAQGNGSSAPDAGSAGQQSEPQPVVNMLSGGLIRKKAKVSS